MFSGSPPLYSVPLVAQLTADLRFLEPATHVSAQAERNNIIRQLFLQLELTEFLCVARMQLDARWRMEEWRELNRRNMLRLLSCGTLTQDERVFEARCLWDYEFAGRILTLLGDAGVEQWMRARGGGESEDEDGSGSESGSESESESESDESEDEFKH